VHPYLQLESKK